MRTSIIYWIVLGLLITACSPAAPNGASISPTETKIVKPTLEISDADLQGSIAVCVNSMDGIRVMKADGSQISESITDSWSCDPDWTPDGSRLAIVIQGYNIAVSDADGGDLQVLTACSGICEFPDWSSNGKKIVYNTGHPSRVGSSEYVSGGDIMVMDANGANQAVLYHGCVASHASWSPDGSQIAFQAECNDRKDIYKMDADGGNVMKLTSGQINHTEPAWSPDGKFIAFVAGNKINVMKKDGSRLRQLPTQDAHFPTWSPDSQCIAYSTKDGLVMVIRVDGTGLRFINTGVDPSWAP